MLGDHLVRSWSTAQAVIVLSSGEAEFYYMVKGGAQALGMKAMMGDQGSDVGIIF